MTERMERILVLMRQRNDSMTCAEIAYGLGFRDGMDFRRSAHDGRWMSPAQRVIFPVIALRKRGLVSFAPRNDGRTGSADVLTLDGERLADELLKKQAEVAREQVRSVVPKGPF